MPPDPQPQATSTAGSPSWMAPMVPAVPDHELVRRIGGGSYGDVWLARTTLGTWRAVKVVFRDRFTDARPYEREFHGMQKFEPLSRGNEAFVDILQIGRNDAGGYFYYVMELADDTNAEVGTRSAELPPASPEPIPHSALRDPRSYVPKTLSKVLLQRGRLPVTECLELGLTLNLGLAQLHRAGLIHRDIKPSNLIFVGGVPKLADIGLVIEVAEARSFVGTEGFIPPEGPNSPQADLYSLGKVLYEAGMGKDRKDFPEPFTQLAEAPDSAQLLEFNAILLRACAANRAGRYQSAEEMNADLALLQSGGSVRQQRRVARQLRFVQRAGVLVTALAAVIALGWWWQVRQTSRVRDLATENLELAQRADTSATAAQKSEATARESLYAADIQLAQQALKADNLRLAQSLLQNHVPKPGQPDLRGFEWRYLWQQCRSEELFSLKGHTNASRVLAMAPDGRLLAVGGYDGGNIRLLDLRLRREVTTLPDTNTILSLSFSPKGEILASGSPNDIRLWDTQSFQEVRRLTNAAAPALFSPDGRFLLTGRGPWKLDGPDRDQPKELMVWDTQTWTVIHTATFPASGSFSGSRDLYLQIAFGADASRVAVLVGDTVRIVTCPGLNELQILPDKLAGGSQSRPFLSLSPDNRTLAIPSPKGFGVRLWDIVENRELRVLPGHADHIFSARFSPDGTLLATASPDQTTKLWQVATGDLLHTFRGQADEVVDVAFSPDGKLLASLGITESTVMMWDPRTRPRREVVRRPVVPAGFEPDGGLVSFRVPGLRPAVLDPASLEIAATTGPRTRKGIGYGIYPRSLSSDGRLQGLWSLDEQRLEVWDRNSRELLCSVPAQAPLVSFDSTRNLATTYVTNAAGQGRLNVWQLPQGSLKWQLVSPGVFGLMVSSNGCYLSTQDGSNFYLWRVEGDALAPVLTFPSRDVIGSSVVSPDGRWLATAQGDITLRALPSAGVVGVLKGHTRKSIKLDFSPDSRTLASMADDRTVRLWHVATQRELLRFQAPSEDRGPFFLEFSPDGRALATMRSDEEGPITWLHFAPSLAEIAAMEGGDYRTAAGRDSATWLAVAKSLQRVNRGEEALQACAQTLQLVGARKELAWLRDKALRHRADVLRGLGRNEEAGADNLSLLGLPARDPATPAGAIDLSAYYNAPLAWDTNAEGVANDLSELPTGPQVFAGTVFDVRGDVGLTIRSTDREWPIEVTQVDGIRIQRRLTQLHFLQAAGAESRSTKTGDRIGHYRIHFADGRDVVVPIRYNVDTSDYWELDHLPKEVPEASLAWRGQNPRSRADGLFIRLFKRTWENPHPDVEVTRLDFVAEHPRTHPMLIAITAE